MHFFRRFTVGTRLALGFTILLLLGLAGSGLGIERLRALRDLSTQLGTRDAETLVLTQQWVRAIESNAARTWVVFFATEPAVVGRVKDEMKGVVTTQTARLKRLGELAAEDPQAVAMINEISRERDAFQAQRNALLKRKEAGEDVGAEVIAKVFPAAASYNASVEKFAEYERRHIADTLARAEQAAAQGILALALGAALAMLAGAALAWTITRSVVAPIRQAQAAADAIAAGDLATPVPVEGRDEIAALMGAMAGMAQSLRRVVGQVRESSDSIATGSTEIATGNSDLSQRTEEQASNLQQTAASMRQLT
ncbi:MAG: HAMP domain-containing protein, partial [Comamonadaceae bacterium]